MRIISGFAKGRQLFAPAGNRTRPTSDKLRGSLFNILVSRVPGARVLDLFGGTGALALEAMSRGAESAVIADMDRAALEAIRRNAQNVMGGDTAGRVDIIKADYRRAISALAPPAFDLVFLDPPYAMAEAYREAQELLLARGLISAGGVFVCERARDAKIQYAKELVVFDTRLYGETAVDMLRGEDQN